MPTPASLSTTATVGGTTVQSTESVSANVAGVFAPAPLAAAKAGVLTTRTTNTSGTLTMDAGHGFATGDRLDVFWVDPDGVTQRCQYKVTAGTVATNSVPISAGVGDNLPVATTAVTVQKAVAMDFLFNHADLSILAVGGTAGGKVVFEKADGTVVFNVTLQANGRGTAWSSSSGLANPVTDTVAKAYATNASASYVNSVTAVAALTG